MSQGLLKYPFISRVDCFIAHNKELDTFWDRAYGLGPTGTEAVRHGAPQAARAPCRAPLRVAHRDRQKWHIWRFSEGKRSHLLLNSEQDIVLQHRLFHCLSRESYTKLRSAGNAPQSRCDGGFASLWANSSNFRPTLMRTCCWTVQATVMLYAVYERWADKEHYHESKLAFTSFYPVYYFHFVSIFGESVRFS